ncbi:PREDICTED: neuropeptide Y receptor type 1-like [Nicrophorus vespilloides]|uniref:Neuropeptide Y receptor type 1-like n=1 Tax=Nicrophorus vespilloides TaxID=110193 RepID=A0ABM1MQX0_NICVS|nr:PREDICTED: neuropeptide Y receptor type 1-like [Nicrophorus vespilloides]
MMKGDTNGSASLIDDIPPDIAEKISTYLSGGREDFDEFQTPIIRSSFEDYMHFIIFMYSLLIVCGVLTNLALLFHVVYRKLYKDETYVFFINNALSDIVKCVCVIPISLYVLLVENWMLGEVLCSVIPMIQKSSIS